MDQIIIESIADGAAAWMLGELPDISGITTGNNCQWNVYRGGLTKIRNGNACRMSAGVFGKGVGSSFVGGIALDVHYANKEVFFQ